MSFFYLQHRLAGRTQLWFPAFLNTQSLAVNFEAPRYGNSPKI